MSVMHRSGLHMATEISLADLRPRRTTTSRPPPLQSWMRRQLALATNYLRVALKIPLSQGWRCYNTLYIYLTVSKRVSE